MISSLEIKDELKLKGGEKLKRIENPSLLTKVANIRLGKKGLINWSSMGQNFPNIQYHLEYDTNFGAIHM